MKAEWVNRASFFIWVFRRDGLDISRGQKSSFDMGLGVHSDGLWVYSNYVNMTSEVDLFPGDVLMVWVEVGILQEMIYGVQVQNFHHEFALEIMHFTPDLVSIWIENEAPEVGDIIEVDVRIHNIGNLAEK